MKTTLFHYCIFIMISSILVSCSSTRMGLAPARGQSTQWTSGSEVLIDSSKTLIADCKVYSIGPPVQFMVHLVNKGEHPINVNPSSIYTIQTNENDETSIMHCISPDYVSSSTSNANSSNHDAAVGTAVVVGLLAVLVVGAAIAASSSSKSSRSNNSHSSYDSHHHSNYNNNFYNYNNYNYSRSYNHCDNGYASSNYSNPSKSSIPFNNIERLVTQTLQPGSETNGVVQVHTIPNLKKLILVVPGIDSSDEVHLAYDAYKATY